MRSTYGRARANKIGTVNVIAAPRRMSRDIRKLIAVLQSNYHQPAEEYPLGYVRLISSISRHDPKQPIASGSYRGTDIWGEPELRRLRPGIGNHLVPPVSETVNECVGNLHIAECFVG
jgi:hypothetical protein